MLVSPEYEEVLANINIAVDVQEWLDSDAVRYTQY